MELLKLHHDCVCAQVGQRMGILLDGVGFCLQGGQCAPVGGEGAEETVVVKVLVIRSDAQHALDAGQVRDGLGVDHGSVDGIALDGLETVVVVDQLLGAVVELDIILFGPPVAQIPALVVLTSGGIEGVGDLMGYDNAHMAQLFLAGHLVVVENTAQDSCGDIDGVVQRIVVGVDILGGGQPPGAVHRLVDAVRDGQAGVLGDRDARVHQRAALLGALEIKDPLLGLCLCSYSILCFCLCSCVGGSFAVCAVRAFPSFCSLGLFQGFLLFFVVFRACNTDGQAVQLLDRLLLGGVGQEVLALQHGTVVFDNIFDQVCYIGAGLVGNVGLRVDFTQFHFQNTVDGIGGRFFVIDLTGGAGESVADIVHPVIAVTVEKLHELQHIGDQEIGLHSVQMCLVVETLHAGKPRGLLQDEDFGLVDACAFKHPGEREGALLLLELFKGSGIVAADGRVLGVGLRSGHHRGGHLTFKFVAVLQDLVALLLRIAQSLQHISGGLHVAGLCPPAVGVQVVIIHRILEDQAGRADIDGIAVRVIGICSRKGAAEGQGPDGRVRIGQISRHIVQALYRKEGSDDLSEGLDACRIAGIPVHPHGIVILDQLFAVGDIGIGDLLVALEDILQLLIDLQLPLRERIIGNIAGRDRIGLKPIAVDCRMEILGLGKPVEQADIFDQIGADPGIGAC